jgi:hypothetical protein
MPTKRSHICSISMVKRLSTTAGMWLASVRRIKATAEKPHGISYSLTFHAPDGRRLMGYDNAHGVQRRGGRYAERQAAFDRRHRDEADEGQPYPFETAESSSPTSSTKSSTS